MVVLQALLVLAAAVEMEADVDAEVGAVAAQMVEVAAEMGMKMVEVAAQMVEVAAEVATMAELPNSLESAIKGDECYRLQPHHTHKNEEPVKRRKKQSCVVISLPTIILRTTQWRRPSSVSIPILTHIPSLCRGHGGWLTLTRLYARLNLQRSSKTSKHFRRVRTRKDGAMFGMLYPLCVYRSRRLLHL